MNTYTNNKVCLCTHILIIKILTHIIVGTPECKYSYDCMCYK